MRPHSSLAKKSVVAILLWFAILAFYFTLATQLNAFSSLEAYLDRHMSADHKLIAMAIYWLILFAGLLTPFSSATFFVLAVLPVFGPTRTFFLSLTAGISASFIGHFIGSEFQTALSNSFFSAYLGEAQSYISNRSKRTVFVLAFLSRAIPNPLYDVWAYAFGILGTSRITYLVGASFGGSIPLGIICYAGEIFF